MPTRVVVPDARQLADAVVELVQRELFAFADRRQRPPEGRRLLAAEINRFTSGQPHDRSPRAHTPADIRLTLGRYWLS